MKSKQRLFKQALDHIGKIRNIQGELQARLSNNFFQRSKESRGWPVDSGLTVQSKPDSLSS
jgi:hypothetical protein